MFTSFYLRDIQHEYDGLLSLGPFEPSGHTRCEVLLRDALSILASASAGRLGLFHAMSFPGAWVWCPFLLSRVLWRRLRPLPCFSVCELHCIGPTNARQSEWETVISCAGGQVLPGPLRLRIVSDAAVPFCRKV